MYWGNTCNVMVDMYLMHGMITYAMTNLNSAELEAAYGNRVHSRMREMFNLVAFDKNSPDKRS
jgi:hypothetical protein